MAGNDCKERLDTQQSEFKLDNRKKKPCMGRHKGKLLGVLGEDPSGLLEYLLLLTLARTQTGQSPVKALGLALQCVSQREPSAASTPLVFSS